MESKSGFTPSIAVIHHIHHTIEHKYTKSVDLLQDLRETTRDNARPGLTVRVPGMPDIIPVLDVLDQDPDETFGPFGGGVDGDEVDGLVGACVRRRVCGGGGSGGGGGGHDESTRCRWKRGLR